ncbi:MAG: SPOR domain-containing protein [Bacteroidales bacterium]|nr:SPOR domain-containing protein [Bacteroidales bacterium]
MKSFRSLCLLMLFPTLLLAQENVSIRQYENIVDKINKHEPGKGYVKIIQDEQIAVKIGRPDMEASTSMESSDEHRYIQISGWRILVFSGNNQRVSKNEAFRKETDVKVAYPELSTYVKYNAPFWRLRVGDFQTYQDAQHILEQLRHTFPSFGREMSIVKEKIQVKVQ